MNKLDKLDSVMYVAGYVTAIISIVSVIGTTLTMIV